MAKEVIPLPEIRVRNLVRHKLLHGGPKFGILVEIAADIRRLLVNVELLSPRLEFGAGTVLGKTLERRVNQMELCVEPGRVDHPLPVRVLALKQHCAALVVGVIAGRGRNADGVAKEVPKIGAESQERLVCRVLGLLQVLQPLGGLASQPGENSLGFVERGLGGPVLGCCGRGFGIFAGLLCLARGRRYGGQGCV